MNNNPNIFTHEDNPQPFAKRTVSSLFNIGIVLLILGVGIGWYMTRGDNETRQEMQASATTNDNVNVAEVSTNSGAEPAPAITPVQSGGGGQSFTDMVSDFFKGIFSFFMGGISGGASSAGSSNATGTGSGADLVVSGEPLTEVVNAIENSESNTPPSNQQLAALQEMFDGRIVDFEGKPAGDVNAIIRNNNGERSFIFTLDQSLTPADKPREFVVAYDEVEIIQDERGSFVKLSKEQTEAIAKALFDEKSDASKNNKSVDLTKDSSAE